MLRIFQSLLSCRLRRADRGALPRVSRFLFPRAARSFVNSTTQNGKAFRLPVFVWWTCAESNRGLTGFICGHYTLSL